MTNRSHIQTFIVDPIMYPVTIIALKNTLLMDIAGPLQVYCAANQFLRSPYYKTHITTPDGAAIKTDTGLEISADSSFAELPPKGDIIIPGGPSVDENLGNERVLDYLRKATKSQRRVISICSGSMLLAAAGILDGKQATSHWTRSPFLFERFPETKWRPDEIFTQDENIYCSAGVTAGIDLSLALVEEDHGRNLALDVARELVVFMRRSGGQNQYSKPLKAQATVSSKIRDLCTAITEHPADDWRLSRMEAYTNMTERTLHRHFLKEFGESPSRFVEGARLDMARTYLDHGAASIGGVATMSGFGNEQSFRRAFTKYFNVSPSDYRDRFGQSKTPV
ncbi:MAG: helix-turn-helix domain-containing protein [Sneathiella sp.]